MDISRAELRTEGFRQVTDFTANIDNPKYNLREYELDSEMGETYTYAVEGELISILVIEGLLQVADSRGGQSQVAGVEEGFHLKKLTNFKLKALDSKVRFLVAAAKAIDLRPIPSSQITSQFELLPLSSYKITKPWGWERWYTENVSSNLPFALKMIFMEKGKQSSLQSHAQKSETNYVIEGMAKVLFGMIAPDDVTEKIDVSKLTAKIYEPGQGWSNVVKELHRVIAHESYKAVEVSTPELDDVIRWADDANRTHGRIDLEHPGTST